MRLALVILALVPLGARAADECELKCDERAPLVGATLVLDGNSGERLGGTSRVGALGPVRLVVAAPNPFRFQYRAAISTEPLGPALVAEFMKLLAPKGPLDTSGPKGAPAKDGACPRPVSDLLERETRLVGDAEAAVKAMVTDVPRLYQDTAGSSLAASCLDTCRSATRLDEHARQVEGLGQVKALRERLDAAVNALPSPDACRTEVSLLKGSHDRRIGAVQAKVAEFDDLEPFLARVRAALSSRWLLARVHTPSAPDEPYAVKVSLFRQDSRTAGAREELVGSAEITVGRRILSLSGGLAVGWVKDRTVVRVPSATTGESVFGVERASDFRPSVLVALNGVFAEWPGWSQRWSLAATTGVIVDDTSSPDYLLGVSLGLADQAWFVTVGAQLAQVESLARNFKMGDTVPTGLADPLPVERRWTAGAAIALTYRLR